ncbi:unnamed protein product [Cylindrotheca closterium]|uniref:Nudix hydrolase domain-containing protein n=1 Tax=Cylindrotheca closterium TaxID=2856 RepID=A0AAD2PVF2_9STRA|nr:unnamed protein product [Cylindrotheca closterium]
MKRSSAGMTTLALFSTLLSRCGRCTGFGYLPTNNVGGNIKNTGSQASFVSRAFSAQAAAALRRVVRHSTTTTARTTPFSSRPFFHSIANTGCRRTSLVGAFSTVPTSADGCPLEFEIGPYNAAEVSISESSDNNDDEVLLDQIDRSIDYWRSNDYTSAWVSIPTSRARLIQPLATTTEYSNFGFDLHHTNSTLQTIVMKKWLREGTEDKIPPFATHQVGCAGFVLNHQNEILLIKEWSGPLSNRTPTKQWKLPGGLLDSGETFEEAACREVFEETGVPCEFESILTFWHRHGLKFGKSDLYYVCLLRPKSLEIEACPVEVSAAIWMPIDEFLETQDHPLIRHVLKESFDLDGSSSKPVGNVERLSPNAEMQTGGVQWPGRSPYPTYTSKPRS